MTYTVLLRTLFLLIIYSNDSKVLAAAVSSSRAYTNSTAPYTLQLHTTSSLYTEGQRPSSARRRVGDVIIEVLGGSIATSSVSPQSHPTTEIHWTSDANNVKNITQASQCWNDLKNWVNSSAIWYNSMIQQTEITWQVTTVTSYRYGSKVYTTTHYPSGDLSTYTLCDGSARVDAEPTTIYTTSNLTVPVPHVSTWPGEAYPVPQPCTPTVDDCVAWYYDSNIDYETDNDIVNWCGLPAHVDQPCIITGGPARLFYFPVDIEGGNLCNASGTTVTATSPAGAVTTMGQTLSSGSVYIWFSTLYASYDGFWDRVGPTFSSTWLTLRSEEVSTNCVGLTVNGQFDSTGVPLNYADLNYPHPASAYKCQDYCYQNSILSCRSQAMDASALASCDMDTASAYPECKTIWNNFNPNLAVPTKIRDMVPEWSTCAFYGQYLPNIVFDPPKKLVPAPVEASLTTSNSFTTLETAAPLNAPSTPVPAITSTPEAQQPSSVITSSSRPSDDPASTEVSAIATPSEAETSLQAAPLPTTSHTFVDSLLGVSGTPSSIVPLESSTASHIPSQEIQSDPLNDASSNPGSSATRDPGDAITTIMAPVTTSSGIILGSGISESILQPPQGVDGSSATSATYMTQRPVVTSKSQIESSVTSIGAVDTPSRNTAPVPGDRASTSELIAGDLTITATHLAGQPGVIAVGQVTLTSGASGMVTGGETISYGRNGIVVDYTDATVTYSAPGTYNTNTRIIGQTAYSFEGHTIIASEALSASDAVVVNGITLSLGGTAAVFSGHTISKDSDGLVVINPTRTIRLPAIVTQPSPTLTNGQYLMHRGNFTITAASVKGSPYAVSVDGTTISPGGDAVVINGQTVSMASSGLVVYENITVPASDTNPAITNLGHLPPTSIPLPPVESARPTTTTSESLGATWKFGGPSIYWPAVLCLVATLLV